MSSGGAMAAAVRLASKLESGVIVTIVCDRGDRYLSSGIFAKDYKQWMYDRVEISYLIKKRYK